MTNKELVITELGKDLSIRPHGLEPWMQDLANFVIQAEKNHKLIRCKYQGLIFEPIDLMQNLIDGRFIWGIVNWETIDRPTK